MAKKSRHNKVKTETARMLRRDPCCYCGAYPGGSVDHIDAGGTGEWTNLTGACRQCNNDKASTELLFFLYVKAHGGWMPSPKKRFAGSRATWIRKGDKVRMLDGRVGEVIETEPKVLLQIIRDPYPLGYGRPETYVVEVRSPSSLAPAGRGY